MDTIGTASLSSSNRKIDPTRRPARPLKGDGTPNDNDRVEIGPTALAFSEWEALGLALPNLPELREYRLGRIREQLRLRDYGGILLFDPLNIRYATDSSNMQLWVTHNACRACFIPTEGPVILWDFHNCEHLSEFLPLVDEVRHGASFFYFESGDKLEQHASEFAHQIDELMRKHAGRNRKLAVDKMEIVGIRAFDSLGIDICEGQAVTEHARAIKNENELNAMRCAIAACEAGMDDMRRVMRPGVTENEMWAALHHGNIIRGGEWIETRLLASGPRTNPWFHECGPRVIQNGDIVAFDTDLIGPYGYCADISRTWLCGDGKPTAEQKTLYQMAHDHIMSNMALLAPGVSFRELMERGHRLPTEYRNNRYGVMFHGVGLCDEYPSLRYPEDWDSCGYDGVLKPGMTLCVEAYIGVDGGREGVKLEDQVVITETGYENLTRYPFEKDFLD
ncbi:dimethylsulfonioproprionate lyase DddP [Aestuariispira insulae]|uniref:Dimethylsulfoniopropionate lyase DddP n=1 Tax=Aestuariispira insulae TaxID=1461337 RepID=A0A3D9H5K6_9PROT|nr:dimethylsulfonioproprionate lyase DddP [Aestuariispira insulae]RED44256.1 dimethylsulfoniopropionate lyase DddP [Aestuariispira insulae]